MKVLHIEAHSEAENYFKELIEATNVKNVKATFGVVYEDIICNDYTIDDESYEKIRSYLKDRG